MAQVTWSEEAWVANVGMEGTNGATRGLSVGIDGPGGMVDGVGGEVNKAVQTRWEASSCMFWGADGWIMECGDSEGFYDIS